MGPVFLGGLGQVGTSHYGSSLTFPATPSPCPCHTYHSASSSIPRPSPLLWTPDLATLLTQKLHQLFWVIPLELVNGEALLA